MQVSTHQPKTAMRFVAPWLKPDRSEHISLGSTVSYIAERTLNENEHLFLEGEKQSHVYIVLSGVVGLYNLLADGRRQISTFAYPGDFIGLDSTEVHVSSAEALSLSRVRCIPVAAIEKLIMSEPGFGHALLRLAANELADSRNQLMALGRKSAAEKLAGFLLRAARRTVAAGQSGQVIQIPVKRSEIADFLGLTIETVSRNFTKLKSSQVIHLKSNSEIEILDMPKLVVIAEGNDVGHRH